MTLTPTDEQQAIIDAAKSTKDSLLINALAGAAKTTTLELIVKALPVQPILSIAFNKRIAEEMRLRLPGHVKVSTINALGHGVWASHTGRKLTVQIDKTYNALKELVDTLGKHERMEVTDVFSDILRAVATAKMQGYVPEGLFPNAQRLIDAESFADNLEEEVPLWVIDKLLERSIGEAYSGLIDFNDQVYMPTLFGGNFPKFPLTMVDEAQDLSPLNHRMVDKLFAGRLIAVGDPWQSIYAFRGADIASMARLRDRYSMREMTLSISFRCPIAVVKQAHSRVPHMKWAPWALEGLVSAPAEWFASAIPDGSAIICRLNAPLFRCALELLRLGRGVKLVGTDLGPSLTRTLKKLGPPELPREETFNAISKWETETLRKRKNKAAVADKADCLRVFAGFGETLGAAIAYAEHLFSVSGPIQLLSGHKAKGLEWDTVYHLDPWRVPSKWAESAEEKEQELNVKYVIETRAKKELWLVNLEELKP